MSMAQVYGEGFGATAPENYERFFVPAIGRPLAEDLIGAAGLREGESVLDVACGTGVIARLAAEAVGPSGRVSGLDVTPGMLTVARARTPAELEIGWHEASAEAMPLADESFDVVLCQMGLQFIPDKLAALREMRRVLREDGRACLNVPGPKPALFAVMTDALAEHIAAEVARFGDLVFSLHDPNELAELMRHAGFRDVRVEATTKRLSLPPPADFLWQYVGSTPMAEPVAHAERERLAALERDVCRAWEPFVADGGMSLEVRMTTAIGFR